MKRKLLSTDTKRRKIAKAVSAIATDALGIPVNLTRGGEWFRDEYKFRAEYLETERGPLWYLHIDVDTMGIDVHSRFEFPEFAPAGANTYSGKWNHYIWPGETDTAADYMRTAEMELRNIFAKLQLRPGVTRADRPSKGEFVAFHCREVFAA